MAIEDAFGSTKTQSLLHCLHQSMDAERLCRDPPMLGERVMRRRDRSQ